MARTSEYPDSNQNLDHQLRWQSLSKETLTELLKLYGELFAAIDGFWYLAVKERNNNENALACDLWVWEKYIHYELKRIVNVLNISGNDVVALMKALQLSPWFTHQTFEVGLKGKNHAILTVTRCNTLEALEKENGERIGTICGTVDPFVFKKYAEFFNPEIKVKPLKLPPRQSKQGICCQWEFSAEPS